MSARQTTRALYLDLDGTLLGRGASLLQDGDGDASLDGARAVHACLRAGVEVVLMSGRRPKGRRYLTGTTTMSPREATGPMGSSTRSRILKRNLATG